MEADGAVDAQNAPTAPWKTLCVFHELPQGLSHQVTHEKLRKAPKYRWETRIDPKNPVSRVGDIWTLGKHRIVCGDSTDQKTVERLLDGVEPDLMVTDPPYGVQYDSSWRYKAGISSKDGAFGKSANDDQNDWQAAYALFPGSIAYVWMSGLGLPVAASGLDACGFIRRSLIIWDKGHIVIGRGHYNWRHESCWYAVKKGAQPN